MQEWLTASQAYVVQSLSDVHDVLQDDPLSSADGGPTEGWLAGRAEPFMMCIYLLRKPPILLTKVSGA